MYVFMYIIYGHVQFQPYQKFQDFLMSIHQYYDSRTECRRGLNVDMLI